MDDLINAYNQQIPTITPLTEDQERTIHFRSYPQAYQDKYRTVPCADRINAEPRTQFDTIHNCSRWVRWFHNTNTLLLPNAEYQSDNLYTYEIKQQLALGGYIDSRQIVMLTTLLTHFRVVRHLISTDIPFHH
jgi:hypothetical protein